ncbi:hypothetical protein ACQR1I_13975 [Bradyrhizobium sp. HKCCYLS2038]|uniref:hypothetical protein n=1 Tax=unclassified Bradyrhizobium TaxID=2631580 RepID=UPI003EBC8855
MPGLESFASILDTLAAARRDYHEKLKSIPQYEAYLLIESSTEKAAGALHGTEASSSSIAADVIDSLQYARTRFEQHMASIPEYRVLTAIDKVIKEISQHLGLAKDDATPQTATVAHHEASEPVAADDAEPEAAAETASTETAAEPAEPESDDEPAEPEVAEETDEPAQAEAPTLRIVEAPAQSPSIVPAGHDADAAHDDDIVVLNAPAWDKSGADASHDITARLAAKAASAAIDDTDEGHDTADHDLVVVSQREPSDHEAA